MTSNGKLLAIIPEGYKQDGYIAQRDRIHPAVCFTFAPLLASERSVVAEAILKGTPLAQQEELARIVAKQLTVWDVVDAEGALQDIKQEVVARLQPELLNRFYAVLMGTDGGDVENTED